MEVVINGVGIFIKELDIASLNGITVEVNAKEDFSVVGGLISRIERNRLVF